MHRAECVDRRRYDPLRVVRVPQVGNQLLDPTRHTELGFLEFGNCRAQFFIQDVHQEHRRSAFEQCGGNALADALGGTRDDGNVAAHRGGVGVPRVRRSSHLTGPISSRTPRCIS